MSTVDRDWQVGGPRLLRPFIPQFWQEARWISHASFRYDERIRPFAISLK